MSVEDLGKKLLAEVEEVGLDEILSTLRLNDDTRPEYFGLPALNGLLSSLSEARSATAKPQPGGIPIIELLSLHPAGGKTQLLYHLTALAVLPTNLRGQQTATIILDTDNRFSVRRLAQQMALTARPHFNSETSRLSLKELILDSLRHVHIFHPQSLVSTVATLHSLQTYLFDATQHHSFDRAIGFIALDSASSFYWQNKSDIEHAALIASTSRTKPVPQPNGYVQLAAALKNCFKALHTPVIFTTSHLGPLKNLSPFSADARPIRPSLPPPWQSLPTLRLIVQRVPVRRFPIEMSVEEALRETEMRQTVVDLGKFECFVNEWGLDEGTLGRLYQVRSGFEMFITGSGVAFPNASDG